LELLVVKTLLHHKLFEPFDAFFLSSLLFGGLTPEALNLALLRGHGLTEVGVQDSLVRLNLFCTLSLMGTDMLNGLTFDVFLILPQKHPCLVDFLGFTHL
jgi:hypothetical protein